MILTVGLAFVLKHRWTPRPAGYAGPQLCRALWCPDGPWLREYLARIDCWLHLEEIIWYQIFSCSLLDLLVRYIFLRFSIKPSNSEQFLEILWVGKPWFEIAVTLMYCLYLPKSIKKVNTDREGALMHYSCRRGSYYSVGLTNTGGRPNRCITVFVHWRKTLQHDLYGAVFFFIWAGLFHYAFQSFVCSTFKSLLLLSLVTQISNL